MPNAVIRTRGPQAIAILLILAYCMLLLVNAPSWYPTLIQELCKNVQGKSFGAISRVVFFFYPNAPGLIVSGTYFLLVAGALPLMISKIAGRRWSDLGWRVPNKLGSRYFLIAFMGAVPFLIWMVKSPTIAEPYLVQLRRAGFALFAGFYFVNMFTEHLLLHGVVLGLTYSGGRWPSPAPIPPIGGGPRKMLRCFGMAMPASHSVTQWLGLAPRSLLPIFISALLFGLVHLGKDTRELVLAFPGGLVQAYIAYRTNSWFTPFFIHLATACAALVMMIWMRHHTLTWT